MPSNLHVFQHVVVMLIVIASIYAKIQISVQPESDKGKSVITFSGADEKIVTEKEIRLYNITKDNLKRGVRVELGKVPDDVFLKDPTPYNNLFEKFKWLEVKRSIRVKSAKVFEIIKENVTLTMLSVTNNTTERFKKKIDIKETVENIISSVWLEKGLPDDNILYKTNVTYDNQSFLFENRWRSNNYHSVTLLFGKSNIGYIFLAPGQTVNIELTAVKTILLLKVDYSAILIGRVVANYNKLYGKHHFWAPSVGSVMEGAKLKNEIVTTEFIEFRYYADPRVKLIDKYTHYPVSVMKPPTPFNAKKDKNK